MPVDHRAPSVCPPPPKCRRSPAVPLTTRAAGKSPGRVASALARSTSITRHARPPLTHLEGHGEMVFSLVSGGGLPNFVPTDLWRSVHRRRLRRYTPQAAPFVPKPLQAPPIQDMKVSEPDHPLVERRRTDARPPAHRGGRDNRLLLAPERDDLPFREAVTS